jgi:hypothetical protein
LGSIARWVSGVSWIGRDLDVVVDAALVERDARRLGEDLPPLVLDGEVGRQNHEPDPASTCDAIVGLERQVFDQDHLVIGQNGGGAGHGILLFVGIRRTIHHPVAPIIRYRST